MRAILTALLVFPAFFTAFTQQIKIKGCVKDMPYSKIYFAEIVSGKMNYLDSAVTNNGCFDFYVSDTIRKGMYSIVLNKQQNAFIRIILNNEKNIEFSTVFSNMLAKMNFTSSQENKLFYQFNADIAASSEKTELLRKLYALYPSENKMRTAITAEINELGRSDQKTADELFTKYPASLASVFIRAQQPVRIPPGADSATYLKEHFFDMTDFGNEPLFRSGVLTNTVLRYLSLYESRDLTFSEQSENYIAALDNILENLL